MALPLTALYIKFIYLGLVLILIQFSLNHLTNSVVIPLAFATVAVLGGIESDYFPYYSNGLYPKFFGDFYYCIISFNPVIAIKNFIIPSIIVLITFVCYGKKSL